MGDFSLTNEACLGALRRLEKRVTRRDVLEYGLQEQQKNKIKATCVDFDPKEPGFGPCFFKPYPTDRLTPPGDNLFPAGEFPEHGEADEEISSLIWSGNARILTNYAERYIIDHRSGSPEDGDTVGAGPGWDYQCLGYYDFRHPGYETTCCSRPEWYMQFAYYHPDAPHMKCSMIYDTVGDNDHVLRGEVLCLIVVMRYLLRLHPDHTIAPVLLFSFHDYKVRILHAYFNGKQLVIHYSKFHEFKTRDDSPWDFFAPWFLSEHTGDTKSE